MKTTQSLHALLVVLLESLPIRAKIIGCHVHSKFTHNFTQTFRIGLANDVMNYLSSKYPETMKDFFRRLSLSRERGKQPGSVLLKGRGPMLFKIKIILLKSPLKEHFFLVFPFNRSVQDSTLAANSLKRYSGNQICQKGYNFYLEMQGLVRLLS